MTSRIRSLFEEEEQDDTRDAGELLLEMESVLRIREHRDGPWHARAKGAKDYGSGDTPGEAMRAALRKRRRA